jgi:hypothetical protein
MMRVRKTVAGTCAALLALAPGMVLAQDTLSPGDTAWMLTSTALVLFDHSRVIPVLCRHGACEECLGHDAVFCHHAW